MRARRLAAALALTAIVLLTVAEFQTVFEVTVGSLQVVKRSATGAENHGYALLMIAICAGGLTLVALRGGRAPALCIVVLGAAALVVALAIDLPDTRGTGRLPESLAYESAQARAGVGLALELVGGALLVVAGVVLSVVGAGGGSGGRGSGGRGAADAGERHH